MKRMTVKQFERNLDACLDQLAKTGEPLAVARPNKKSVIVMREDEYRKLEQVILDDDART
jgi:PHD/YefM family antitoxin component YafN of YafNO toxin-antitoxin module